MKRALLAYFGSSFLLHLLWENLQAPLYDGFTSFQQHFWICFKATWGDLLFMLVIYVVLAVLYRNLLWASDKSAYAHPALWMIALLVGTFLSVGFEFWAVNVDHRWQYSEAMPLIPMLHVGLTPILQMLLIPVIVLLLSRSSTSL